MLRKPALVELVVVQVSPDCRRIGQFRVRGHRGVNSIRLGPSIRGHPLPPGTYTFIARALPSGRTVVDTRLVVVQRASRREIRAARRANACPRASDSVSGAIFRPTDSAAGSPSRPEAAGDQESVPARHRGVLGKRFKAVFAPAGGVPLWIIVLSGLALGLLLTAAQLPKAAPRELAASLALGMTVAAVIVLVAFTLPLV